MKVLLVNPPNNYSVKSNVPGFLQQKTAYLPSLGLLYIASYLEKKTNHSVKIHDATVNKTGYIKIAEIDNRDMINIIPLAQLSSFTKNTVRYGEFSEKENLKIFWSSVNERIYILANESLWLSSKITP